MAESSFERAVRELRETIRQIPAFLSSSLGGPRGGGSAPYDPFGQANSPTPDASDSGGKGSRHELDGETSGLKNSFKGINTLFSDFLSSMRLNFRTFSTVARSSHSGIPANVQAVYSRTAAEWKAKNGAKEDDNLKSNNNKFYDKLKSITDGLKASADRIGNVGKSGIGRLGGIGSRFSGRFMSGIGRFPKVRMPGLSRMKIPRFKVPRLRNFRISRPSLSSLLGGPTRRSWTRRSSVPPNASGVPSRASRGSRRTSRARAARVASRARGGWSHGPGRRWGSHFRKSSGGNRKGRSSYPHPAWQKGFANRAGSFASSIIGRFFGSSIGNIVGVGARLAATAGLANPAGVAIAGVGLLATAAVTAARSLIRLTSDLGRFAESVNSGNRRLIFYNSRIAYGFASLEMGDFRRGIRTASGTEESTVALTKAINSMRDDWVKFDIYSGNIKNLFAIGAASTSGGAGRVGGDLFDVMDRIFSKLGGREVDFKGVAENYDPFGFWLNPVISRINEILDRFGFPKAAPAPAGGGGNWNDVLQGIIAGRIKGAVMQKPNWNDIPMRPFNPAVPGPGGRLFGP